MKIDIYKIPNTKKLVVEEIVELDKEKFAPSFPILEIGKVFAKAKVNRYDDFINIHLSVKAEVILQCSYTLKPFKSKVSGEEEFNFTTFESEEDDDFIIYKGNRIDLDEYIYELIISSVPTSPKAPGARLPKSGEGYRVISEDDLLLEESTKGNDKFDKLADLDLD